LGRGIVLTDVASIEQIQKAAWRKRESEAHHTCGQFHRGLKSPGVDFGTMEGLTKKVSPSGQDVDKGWREAVRQSCASLRREGFSVSNAVGELRMRGTRRGGTLLAAKGPHVVRVLVLLGEDVDSEATRTRVRSAYRRGETRVFVPWTLRWRMLSNVDRWGLRGVSVSTW